MSDTNLDIQDSDALAKAVDAKTAKKVTWNDLLEVQKRLDETQTIEPRRFLFFRHYWHRHPIKRLKQEYYYWKLKRTNLT